MSVIVPAQCSFFDPEVETVQEFLERFAVQMSDALHKVRSDSLKQAALLLRALPVNMVTDLQRRIAPTKLSEATYDLLKANLVQAYSVKKSLVGASINFFRCKQESTQNIEEFSRQLKFLASQCDFENVTFLI